MSCGFCWNDTAAGAATGCPACVIEVALGRLPTALETGIARATFALGGGAGAVFGRERRDAAAARLGRELVDLLPAVPDCRLVGRHQVTLGGVRWHCTCDDHRFRQQRVAQDSATDRPCGHWLSRAAAKVAGQTTKERAHEK